MSGRPQIATMNRMNLAISVAAVGASLALATPRFAGSLAVGALLEAANFRALWRFSERALLGAGAGPAIGAFGLRFVLLGAAVFVALQAGAHPIGLLVGLSLIVPATVIAAWRTRPPVRPAPPGPPPDHPSWDDWNPWLARERTPTDDDEEDPR